MIERMEPSDEDMKMAAEATLQSPLNAALDRNQEIIMAIEKQIEGLGKRLEPVMNSRNSTAVDPGKEDGDRAPNSRTVERIRSQGNQLASISDVISYITRSLEV